MGEHFYLGNLEKQIEELKAENEALKERIRVLTEECCWLEAKSREAKPSTQGEH